MAKSRDSSQYGNEKGVSVNHYLIKMINESLASLDGNSTSEKFAVFCTMVDWKQAFGRQCPTLGVQSFVENGVRGTLVPLLTSYFQNRRMIVNWHGEESRMRLLKGGRPSRGTMGHIGILISKQQQLLLYQPKTQVQI